MKKVSKKSKVKLDLEIIELEAKLNPASPEYSSFEQQLRGEEGAEC